MSTPPENAFAAALDAALEDLGVAVEASRRAQLSAHYELLVEANRQFNLTRITAPEDAAVKHYADSLSLLATGWLQPDHKLTVLDVGTGAGFPALPLAVVCAGWSITAIDGTGKKVRFVESCAQTLGLSNLEARHARLEELVRHAERFDLVLVRAVGKIPDLLGDLVGVTRRGGSIVFYKTDQNDAEVAAADTVAARWRLAFNLRRLALRSGAQTLGRQLVRYRRAP